MARWVWTLLLCSACAAAQAPDAAVREGAAILYYRALIHPRGAHLTLTARLLTESARAGADLPALDKLRGETLTLLDDYAPMPGPALPAAPADPVAALLEQPIQRTPPPGPLLPAWHELSGDPALHGLAPSLLFLARSHGADIWSRLLMQEKESPDLLAAAAPLIETLTGAGPDAGPKTWRGAEPALPAYALRDGEFSSWLEERQADLMEALAALGEGDAPEIKPEALAAHRAHLWRYEPTSEDARAGILLARWYLALAASLPSAAEGNPTRLLQALIGGAQALMRRGEPLGAPARSALNALAEHLKPLAEEPPADWTRMDTRFSEFLADAVALLERMETVGDVLQYQAIAHDLMRLQAYVSMLADHWGAYLAQPFREPVQHILSECLPLPEAAGDRKSCRERARRWALTGAGIPEAAGSGEGPFRPENLLRELELNPWQRVNYLRGYWRQLMNRACSRRERIVNALEWSLGARIYLRLAPSQAPAETLTDLIAAGREIVHDLAGFTGCRMQEGGIPARLLQTYGLALEALQQALPKAIQSFRSRALAAGADVDLRAGARQQTRYAPEDLMVVPCADVAYCGMDQPLPAGADLYRLFPRAYRVADQAGMGELELCYRGMAWRDRRTEASAMGGGVMATYHGRLSFTVEGRFRSPGGVETIFTHDFTSGEEFPYLFGPSEPAVLADPCPSEYYGRQVKGHLPETQNWLVPSRVTFVSRQRSPLDRLFARNWTRGADWRGGLVHSIQSKPGVITAGPEMLAAVNARLADLRRAQRRFLYRLLSSGSLVDTEPGAAALAQAGRLLAAQRAALDATARLLRPFRYAHDAALRASLRGREALLGPETLARLHARGLAAVKLPELGRKRLEAYAPAWKILDANAHPVIPVPVAFSLIRLYQAQARPEPDEPITTSRPGRLSD